MPDIGENGVEIFYTVDFRWGNTTKYVKANGVLALYEGLELNSQYELSRKNLSHSDGEDTYLSDSFQGSARIHTNMLCLYYAGKGELHISLSGGYGYDVGFFDIVLNLTYPDTSCLYL